jgi:hypothetical protein
VTAHNTDKNIIRRIKNKDNPYLMINKQGLDDNRLSWKARGILAHLLARPDDWEINMSYLVNQSPEGESSVRTGIKELEKMGYMFKRAVRNNKGQIEYWERFLYETPADNPHFEADDNPEVDFPHVVNQALQNNVSNEELSITISNITLQASDLIKEIVERSKTLTKDALYTVSEKEQEVLFEILKLNKENLHEVDNSAPLSVLLYVLLTKKTIKNVWQPTIPKTNRQSMAKLIIQYLKCYHVAPSTKELQRMEFELTLASPSVIVRAIKNARMQGYKGKFDDDIRPYIAEVKQIDIASSKNFWSDKAKEKDDKKSFRNIDQFDEF